MSIDPACISVVIPTLNEHAAIARALGCTALEGVERVVVDGGSTDGTVERARELGAECVLEDRANRAGQMDAGYRAARGGVLLFLHADTLLPPGWDERVRAALARPEVAGGAFGLRFESERPLYRFIEFGARLRTRLGGVPYGDQALFVRREALDAAGGIAQVPIFEDLDLARSIRRSGELVLIERPVMTSPRRYEANGVLRTWLRNSAALSAYLLGVDRERVARWYRRHHAR